MPEETKTVIRVFEKDAEKLKRIFGQPQWQAFHLALAKAPCEHPEGKRAYTTAYINKEPGEALNIEHREDILMISGFRCAACGAYVFPAPAEDEYDIDA